MGSVKYKVQNIADLIPYVNNSRTHSDEQISQIAASIKEFGFVNPVLVGDDNVLIAGHGRILAAKKCGIKQIPSMIISGLTDTQRKVLVLADNRIAMSAGWDAELLGLELKALADDGYDISLTGFDEDELSKFMADAGTEGECDPDEVGELPTDPISKLGDIWILGKHRLRCGDSTSATDVAALLNGIEPHLMVTDPPYGVEYDASWRDEALGGKKNGRATGKVKNDNEANWSEAYSLFPGEVVYIWHAGNKAHIVAQSLIEAGFGIRAQIIWSKSHFAISRGHYHPQHEPCWYAVKARGGATGHWKGDRKQTTIWEIPKPQKSETGHSTQKPVECMKRPIENNSSPGQVIYEPFSGSGTTIIAGEMTGRPVFAMELDPCYVDMAVQRWEKFTGQKAVLAGAPKKAVKKAKENGRKTPNQTTN